MTSTLPSARSSITRAMDLTTSVAIGPIKDVIVGENATVDARRRDTGDIVRIHPIVDALTWPWFASIGNRSLQIDDAGCGGGRIQRGKGITPDIGRIDSAWYRTVLPFGEMHILKCRAGPGLVKPRVSGMFQYLVDPAARHHIAAEEKGDAGRTHLNERARHERGPDR